MLVYSNEEANNKFKCIYIYGECARAGPRLVVHLNCCVLHKKMTPHQKAIAKNLGVLLVVVVAGCVLFFGRLYLQQLLYSRVVYKRRHSEPIPTIPGRFY
jgi:hypothetical protein